MVWIKRTAWAVALAMGLILLALALYALKSLPTLDGSLKGPGLGAPVHIDRDASDVTHIRAASARDAYWAMGYTHAQERSWQLEFNRRIMHGELSEILGSATLETDRLMRTLGIWRAAQKQWEGLSPKDKDALQAYADGINSFHQASGQVLPPEFHILRVKPGLWTPQDSVAWSLMMALDLGGNWGTEFARLSVLAKVNTAQQWQLFPPYPGESPASSVDLAKLYQELGVYRVAATPSLPSATKTVAAHADSMPADSRLVSNPADTLRASLARDVVAWAAELGNVEGKGSNNWVVAGSHSASGKPLLANDPHLGLSAPAIWYFAHLEAPGLNAIGATLPGLPFVVLGRTDQVAWGFTNTGPDVQDLYLEAIDPENPARYRTPEGWAEFTTRKETIKVKGQGEATFVVRETRHGPVLSDAQKSHADVLNLDRYVLALRWSALDADNRTVAAGLVANAAHSVEDLSAAYASYHSPMQNVVMADASGHIAYKAVGKVPLRRADNDIRGVAPSPGWDARYDWQGWIPYDQTPQADGVAKGWFATANQRITPPGYPYFIGGDWTTPERFDRIEQMLAATPRHSVDSMMAMQADQRSLAALALWPSLQASLANGSSSFPALAAVRDAFNGFDGIMRADRAAPLVFAAWADELARGLIAPTLGEEGFKRIYGRRHLRAAVEAIMASNDRFWCGPVGCLAQSNAALNRALQRLASAYGPDPLSWRWGNAHPAVSIHRPFSNVAMLAKFFEVRVPTGGDPFTVNVGQYWLNDAEPFANRHAASLRAVYDLADLENSRFIYQTGQSGNVFSGRYRDMAAEWAAVQYRPLRMRVTVKAHELVLVP